MALQLTFFAYTSTHGETRWYSAQKSKISFEDGNENLVFIPPQRPSICFKTIAISYSAMLRLLYWPLSLKKRKSTAPCNSDGRNGRVSLFGQ